MFLIIFLAFDFCRFCVVIRFFHPRHSGQLFWWTKTGVRVVCMSCRTNIIFNRKLIFGVRKKTQEKCSPELDKAPSGCSLVLGMRSIHWTLVNARFQLTCNPFRRPRIAFCNWSWVFSELSGLDTSRYVLIRIVARWCDLFTSCQLQVSRPDLPFRYDHI